MTEYGGLDIVLQSQKQWGPHMFESQSINIILTILFMVSCMISPEFAASVVAGAIGMFAACAYVMVKNGGPTHPVNLAIRRSRAIFARG